ncbi:hypothetical protein SDRG_14312 [Saprolegnia diclina VS20]|uniref:Dynein heavy chain coiled coil stalk domain-containing protein n=1 Tax=Saprolegnia diclina (strain VS20) TaxID=1156394 RepID=T0Q057_SAPDV|nr:hypothetical protein SDRG_14312 [Saprolegnia diclina VS20]EQC27891.1 hypothetical protein SDRG_14312 [Saprolegnia diclina VS20]|eukprot:XP_008618656.1 hypothetical protein SDRG_14312 [Saprolegnia diclina VS20]
MASALHYPYRPKARAASSHESLHKAIPARPVMNHPFHALTREEMGWHGSPTKESLRDAKSLKPKPLRTTKLNATQKREFGWDTSFPAEYGLTNLARDFKDTLSYTNNKIKEAHETKQVLEHGHKHVHASDIQHNIAHLQEAFGCQQPSSVPTTDPKHEILVMKNILIREGLVSRLKGVAERISIGDVTSLKVQNADSLLSILLQTRDASVAVVQALYEWQLQLPSPQTYIFSGKSYVHRMLDDLNFLAEIPRLADVLGVAPESMVRNPFMLPTSIPGRDLEPVHSMASPPFVSTVPNEATAGDIVTQADAFLVWCCLHLNELPPEVPPDASVPETAETAPPSGMSTLEVLQWQQRAEMQLKLLSMPMESSLGVHVMDSSALMKRKGYLPSLPMSPPKTLKDLMHTVHDGPPAKKPSTVIHVTVPYTNPKYAKVKPRVSAESFPHQKKPPRPGQQATKPNKRLKKPYKKTNPVVLTLQNLSVTHLELEALSRDEAPPQVVALIVATVMILLTPGDLVPKDVSWSTARTLLANGKQLLRTLHTFLDGPPVAAFKMKALSPFLTNEKFRPAYLVPISTPAAVLCAWVLETVSLQNQPSAKSTSQLLEPGAETSADTSDLLMYLEMDDTNPQVRDQTLERVPGSRPADVFVLQDDGCDGGDGRMDGADPTPDTVVFSGSWNYHALTYFVSFYVAQIEPTCVLQLKLFEPQSAVETQAVVHEDEIMTLFGPHVLAFVYERAWVPLCESILVRLDHVMNPGGVVATSRRLSAINQHDDEDLLLALDTSRSIEIPLPQLSSTPRTTKAPVSLVPRVAQSNAPPPVDMDAILKIQCATRQKLSREKAKRLRRHKHEKRKNPTLFMSADQLRDYEDHVLQLETADGAARNDALLNAQDAAILRIQCASRQRLSRQRVAKKRKEQKAAAPVVEVRRRRSLVAQQADFVVDIAPAFETIQRKARKSIEYLHAHPHLAHLAHATSVDHDARPHRLSAPPDPLDLYSADDAAVRIQCLARQRLARKRVTARRHELLTSVSSPILFVDEETAALRIQCLARQRFAKKRVTAKRNEVRRSTAPQLELDCDAAAVRIQCIARQRAARRRVEAERRDQARRCESRYDADIAALRIQCLARQRAAKMRVADRRRQSRVLQASLSIQHDTDVAALRIQCLARQRAAKKTVARRRRESQSPVMQLDQADAALRIQCLARQRAARITVATRRQDARGAIDDLDAAALRIQCLARRRAAIKAADAKRLAMRPRLPARSLSFGASDKDRAAVRIQSIARQSAAKKAVAMRRQETLSQAPPTTTNLFVSEKDSAALHIQCLIRQRAAKKRVAERRAQVMEAVQEDDDGEYAGDDFGSPPPSREHPDTLPMAPTDLEMAPMEEADALEALSASNDGIVEPKDRRSVTTTDDKSAPVDEYAADDFGSLPPSRAGDERTSMAAGATDQILLDDSSDAAVSCRVPTPAEYPGDGSKSPMPPSDWMDLDAPSSESTLLATVGEIEAVNAASVVPPLAFNFDVPVDIGDGIDDVALPLHVPSPCKKASARGEELVIECDDAPMATEATTTARLQPAGVAPERPDFELTPRLPDFSHDDDATLHVDDVVDRMDDASLPPVQSAIDNSTDETTVDGTDAAVASADALPTSSEAADAAPTSDVGEGQEGASECTPPSMFSAVDADTTVEATQEPNAVDQDAVQDGNAAATTDLSPSTNAAGCVSLTRDTDPTELTLVADARPDESDASPVVPPSASNDRLDSSRGVDDGARTSRQETNTTERMTVASARDNGDDVYEEAFDDSARSINNEASIGVGIDLTSDVATPTVADDDVSLPNALTSAVAAHDAVGLGTTDTDATEADYSDDEGRHDEAPLATALVASRSSTARYSDDASTPRANDIALDADLPLPLTNEPTLGHDTDTTSARYSNDNGSPEMLATSERAPTARESPGHSARYSDDGELNQDTLSNDSSVEIVEIRVPDAPTVPAPTVEGEDKPIYQRADITTSSDAPPQSNIDSTPIQEAASMSEPPALDVFYDDEPSASGDLAATLDTASAQDTALAQSMARPDDVRREETANELGGEDPGRYSSASPRIESALVAESAVPSKTEPPPRPSLLTDTGNTKDAGDGVVADASDAPLETSAAIPSATTSVEHSPYDEDEYSVDFARDEVHLLDDHRPDATPADIAPRPVVPAISGGSEAVMPPSAAREEAAAVDSDQVYEDDAYENDPDTGRYSNVSVDMVPAEASVAIQDKSSEGTNEPPSVSSKEPSTDADATEYDDDTELYNDAEVSPPVAISEQATSLMGADISPPMTASPVADEIVNETNTGRRSDAAPEPTNAIVMTTIEPTMSITAPAVAPLLLERATGDDTTPRYSDDGSARTDAAPATAVSSPTARTDDQVASGGTLPTQDNPSEATDTSRFSDDSAPVATMPSLSLASNAVLDDTFDTLYTPPSDHRPPSLAKRGSVSSVISASPLPSNRSYDNDFDDAPEQPDAPPTLLHAESSYSLDDFDA